MNFLIRDNDCDARLWPGSGGIDQRNVRDHQRR